MYYKWQSKVLILNVTEALRVKKSVALTLLLSNARLKGY